MSNDSETPFGVKMLADHLVKVKLQYEGIFRKEISHSSERINELMLQMRSLEKEKDEICEEYKLMEEELEARRSEIFTLKRSLDVQQVLEERENWNALVLQQKQVNSKLERG